MTPLDLAKAYLAKGRDGETFYMQDPDARRKTFTHDLDTLVMIFS